MRYLVPMALDLLEQNPWAGGNMYPGDLLKTVAEVPVSYWSENSEWVPRFQGVLDEVMKRHRFVENEVLPAWRRVFGAG